MRIGGFVEPAEYVEGVTIYVDGKKLKESDYTVADGIVTFKQAPAGTVTADYTYYWKVIFAEDGLTISKKFQNINTCSLKLEVAR